MSTDLITITRLQFESELSNAKAEALEEAADRVMGPSEYLADRATCHNIANDLRARAAETRKS